MPARITLTLTPCALLCSLSRPEKQQQSTQNAPADLRDQERKTSQETEPSDLCLDRGLCGSSPVALSEEAGKIRHSLFSQVGKIPEELPIAFLFMNILQNRLLLSPEAQPCSSQSNFISTERNHSWFRSKDLTTCLEVRRDTQQKIKQNKNQWGEEASRSSRNV